MEFEWDENKRIANLEKHGFDFAHAPLIWTCPMLPVGMRESEGERRHIAVAVKPPDETIIVVVYTLRPAVIRIISIRRARHYERAYYQKAFGRGT